MPQGAQLPPRAPRNARSNRRPDPGGFCRIGRPPPPAWGPAAEKPSSAILRQPLRGHLRGWGVAGGQGSRVATSPAWVRFSGRLWTAPCAAGVAGQPPGRVGIVHPPPCPEAGRRKLGAPGKRRTQGRSASPPEHPPGILDKSAYFRHDPHRVIGRDDKRILLHPGPLLKPWMIQPWRALEGR